MEKEMEVTSPQDPLENQDPSGKQVCKDKDPGIRLADLKFWAKTSSLEIIILAIKYWNKNIENIEIKILELIQNSLSEIPKSRKWIKNITYEKSFQYECDCDSTSGAWRIFSTETQKQKLPLISVLPMIFENLTKVLKCDFQNASNWLDFTIFWSLLLYG